MNLDIEESATYFLTLVFCDNCLNFKQNWWKILQNIPTKLCENINKIGEIFEILNAYSLPSEPQGPASNPRELQDHPR